MNTEVHLIMSERRRNTFSVEELTNIIDGGKDQTERRRKLEHLVYNDAEMKSPEKCHMTREARFTEAMRRTVRVYSTLVQNGEINPLSLDMVYLRRAMSNEHTLIIHGGAFLPSLMSFGSDEQVAKWAPLAANLNIIGSYAQTELGHGTFLRGLETVATYDRNTEEFVVNCPQITAMKWWPGDMGKAANHVLLMANLEIDGKSYGMHAFIIQIRDLSTHQPLPGVTVGDIGNKLEFQVTDNGFLYLQNVRIPRANLLCKHAEVSAEGKYKKKGSDRLMYGSMVNIRVNLLQHEAILPLAQACTIAIRYSVVRRQGKIDPKKSEVCVLDFVAQQHKLFPSLATAYATCFAVNKLHEKHRSFLANMKSGDISQLPELHALSAGMKAFVTEQCIAGAETSRRACGGHGYSDASGLPTIITRLMASCTYEGENTVMYLQCARYLVKISEQANTSQLCDSVAYLGDEDYHCRAQTAMDFTSIDVLVKCFQQRSKEVLKEVAAKLHRQVERGVPMHQAWDSMSVFLIKAAKAHIVQFIITTSSAFVKQLRSSVPVKEVLVQLLVLYALHNITENPGDFLKNSVLGTSQCDAVHEAEFNLLARIRPNAVSLVDAFDFSNETLQSCIGAYDGNAYQRLFDCAKRAPLNKTEVHEDTYKYLRPFLLKGRDILEGSSKSKL